jgi:hypothetical protein
VAAADGDAWSKSRGEPKHEEYAAHDVDALSTGYDIFRRFLAFSSRKENAKF